MIEQLAHGGARSGLRKVGNEAGQGIIQPDLALRHQLEDGRRGELLDDGAEFESSVGRDRALRIQIGKSAPGGIKHAPAAGDDHRGPWPVRGE
jgi:hypothetical protein